MVVDFPYTDVKHLNIPDRLEAKVFSLPEIRSARSEVDVVIEALDGPIGTKRLSELARGKANALIVFDDNTRPTPVKRFVEQVLDELRRGGLQESQIEFLTAIGTHRSMTKEELVEKLGQDTVNRYTIHNHEWENPDCLEYIGDTDQGAPVWINKLVGRFDVVVGLGAIMPIDICGFTGGGKILIPGVSGSETVDKMHWTRIDIPSQRILGHRDNPVRASIDALAQKAGLDFIVNVILDGEGAIVDAVAGDMVEAHRVGCKRAERVFGVAFDREYDIVVADGYPFDIEFWQANKALDTAGEVVRKGGVVILVTPCYEGLSRTHEKEILEFGYRPVAEIKRLVDSGKLKHSVVGVHMYQVSTVAVEKARLIMVSSHITRETAERVGFQWAEDAQVAFDMARALVDRPTIAVLKNAARMLPLKNWKSY